MKPLLKQPLTHREQLFTVALAVAVLCSIKFYLEKQELHDRMQALRIWKLRVWVVDAQTGERLNPAINLRGEALYETVTATPSQELEVSWISVEPIPISVSADGYETQSVQVTEDDMEIEVPLHPKEDAEEEER